MCNARFKFFSGGVVFLIRQRLETPNCTANMLNNSAEQISFEKV